MSCFVSGSDSGLSFLLSAAGCMCDPVKCQRCTGGKMREIIDFLFPFSCKVVCVLTGEFHPRHLQKTSCLQFCVCYRERGLLPATELASFHFTHSHSLFFKHVEV